MTAIENDAAASAIANAAAQTQQPTTGTATALKTNSEARAKFSEAWKSGDPKLNVSTTEPKMPGSEEATQKQPVPDVIKSGAAADNFRKIIAERDEIKTKAEAADKRASELQSKLDQLETSLKPNQALIDETKKKLEDVEKRASDYQSIVERFYVEHDPKFQAAFGSRIDSAIKDAQALVGLDKAETLADILTMKPSKSRDASLKAIAADLEDFDRSRLAQVVDRLTMAQRERDGELAKAKENYRILQDQNSKKTAEQQAAVKVQHDQGKAMILKIADELPKAGDFDDDKDAATYRKEWVLNIMKDGTPIADQLRLPALAAEAERLKSKVIPSLVKKNQELETQLKAYQASNPGLNNTGKNGNSKVALGSKPGSPFKDRLMTAWNGA